MEPLTVSIVTAHIRPVEAPNFSAVTSVVSITTGPHRTHRIAPQSVGKIWNTSTGLIMP